MKNFKNESFSTKKQTQKSLFFYFKFVFKNVSVLSQASSVSGFEKLFPVGFAKACHTPG
jgi:hypothetical protein